MTFLLSQLQRGGEDAAGATVSTIYARYSLRYAVYQTQERVTVQFADDPELEKQQREWMAKLAPLRSEITGLVEGWRGSGTFWFAWIRGSRMQESAAERYDRRVAAALVRALEGGVEDAITILTQIREDIIAERKSRARALYLVYAALAVAVFGLLAGLAAVLPARPSFSNMYGQSLWLGVAAGGLGAFFSIAGKIMDRSIRTDLHMQDNIIDALVRVTIGAISGLMIVAFLSSGLVRLTVNGVPFGAPVGGGVLSPWLLTLITGFAAGFLERLLPDLLKTVQTTEGEPPQAPPRPAATPDRPIEAPPAGTAPAAGAALGDAAVAAEVPEAEKDSDGCDVELDEAAGPVTPDERLPQASGGVA